MTYQLILGDCLEIMPTLEAGSVDAIIADWPYGTTACKWDSIIPLDKLWPECKRVIKRNGAIVLFGSEPFSSLLRVNDLKMYKYDWVWDKNTPTGFLNVKYAPLKQHEVICVFSDGRHIYNPQKELKTYKGFRSGSNHKIGKIPDGVYGRNLSKRGDRSNYRFPKSIIQVQGNGGWAGKRSFHPTQKPVALLEYLIKTYTNPGDLVLDNTFGSCTTGEACLRTSRRFIGIEKDADYYQIGIDRMNRVEAELRGDLNHLPMFAEATV